LASPAARPRPTSPGAGYRPKMPTGSRSVSRPIAGTPWRAGSRGAGCGARAVRIEEARGRIIGFGGRAVSEGQEPKYLNTPESLIFHKREAFYGLSAALAGIRRADRAAVVAGHFDRVPSAR